MRNNLAQRLTLWTEAQMAGGASKAELAKALNAKGKELSTEAKPVQDPPAGGDAKTAEKK